MKKKIILTIILCMTFLSGCSVGIELNSQQNNLIAEYAAGVIIENDNRNSNHYFRPSVDITEEPTTEAPTSEEETTEPPTTEGEQPTVEDDTKPGEDESASKGEEGTTPVPEQLKLEEILGLGNISVVCDGFEVLDVIDVADGLFSLESEPGYKFVVLNFTLTNLSEEAAIVNTADEGIIFKASFNDKYKYNNYDASILRNDLTVLNDVTIESGAEYKAVTVYMIPVDVADAIESFILTVASDDKVKGVYTVK